MRFCLAGSPSSCNSGRFRYDTSDGSTSRLANTSHICTRPAVSEHDKDANSYCRHIRNCVMDIAFFAQGHNFKKLLENKLAKAG
jgi:hypothetical protein